jgi:hypothetical protein
MAKSIRIGTKIQNKTSELTAAQKDKAAKYKEKVDKSTAKKEQNFKDVSSRLGDKTIKTFNLQKTTSATGLEKAIFVAGDNLIKAQHAIDDVFYGKFEGVDPNIQNKVVKSIKKALDEGLMRTFDKLSTIDLCNVLSYALNKDPGSTKFDPEKKPTNSLEIAKWTLQKAAYDTQLKIDGYYSSYLDTGNLDSKAKAIYSIINEIKDSFKEVANPTNVSALRDPRLVSSFPQISIVTEALEKYFGDFNKYTDYRQIPSEDLQRLITNIDKVREICILIQGLTTPASAISFVDTVFPNANIAEQVQRLEQLIPRELLYKFLTVIVRTLTKLQSVCNVFSTFINFGQKIISIMILVVNALKIITKFLKILPIPLVFSVSGVERTIDDILQNVVLKFLDKILKVLNQINVLLSLCAAIVEQVSVGIYYIVGVINSMIANLKGCSNVDTQLVADMETQRDNLLSTANGFESFVDNYKNKNTESNNTFGKYTIQIITEQVVDDAINLRRRYGIAQEVNGTIAARSQPTFASDDRIIVNEVKQQLATLGLIKSENLSSFTLEELSTIEESLKFLTEDNISLNAVENTDFDNGLDSGNNENENDGVAINAFVNKLQGGKKLRERMRKMMKQNSDKLKTSLGNTNVKFNADNLPGQNNKAIEEVEKLEKEKADLQQKMAISKSSVEKLAYAAKIKQLDLRIERLENK